MTKYLYVYHGGGSMPQSQAEIDKVMQAWGGWFGSLGAAVVDGGNPVGKSTTPVSVPRMTACTGPAPIWSALSAPAIANRLSPAASSTSIGW